MKIGGTFLWTKRSVTVTSVTSVTRASLVLLRIFITRYRILRKSGGENSQSFGRSILIPYVCLECFIIGCYSTHFAKKKRRRRKQHKEALMYIYLHIRDSKNCRYIFLSRYDQFSCQICEGTALKNTQDVSYTASRVSIESDVAVMYSRLPTM